MSRVKTPLLSPSRSYNKMYCGFFFFKNMEIFDVPGLTLRHELKAGDLGRLIEFSGIYGHSDFDYPIAFEGYVATTFLSTLLIRNREIVFGWRKTSRDLSAPSE